MAHASSPWITQKIEQDFPTEPRWFSGMTIIFLLSGTLDMQVGPQLYRLRPNDILFFRPYEIFAAAGKQQYQALVITIEGPLIRQMCPTFDRIRFDLQLIRFHENDTVYQSVCASLAKVVYARVKPDICSDLSVLSSCVDILTQLIDAYGSETEEEGQAPASYTRQRAVAILQYINENYAEHISLSDIASHVGLHPQYFSAFFRKQFGINFSDYLKSYRVAQSLHAIESTDESILAIAIANGFNNHKSYSAAFQKSQGMLPREYRRQFQSEQRNRIATEPPAQQTELFQFFHPYWNNTTPGPDHSGAAARDTLALTFRADTLKKTAFTNNMLHVVSVGRAFDCLRSDVQQQLRQAKTDLNLEYVRLRDIFSDSLSIYYEDARKNSVFNWRTLDSVFDFLVSLQLKPLAEIGYMPSDLASKKQYAGWLYHPNVSSPKSYGKWANLIRQFISHYISRYGIQEVRSWYFELWTNPNLKLENGYWNESMEAFFHFYQVTYEALRQADPQLQLGTPNFSYPTGMSWYNAFFAFARKNGIRPDYISIHSYGIADGQAENNRSLTLSHYHTGSAHSTGFELIAPQKDYLRQQIDDVHACAEQHGFGALEILVSDWNITYLPQDYTRDTCFMAPYVLYCYSRLLGKAKGLSFWSLSDIHGEFFYSDTMFHGGPGLMDYHGVPKASYLALSFIGRLSRQILDVGEHYILAKQGDGFQLILFNLAFYDQTYRVPNPTALTYSQRYHVFEDVHSLDFHITLAAQPGAYTITHERISRDAGSSYDIWMKMGQPTDLRNGLLFKYLQDRSIPEIYIEHATGPEIVFHAMVEPHGAVFITIDPAEP